MLELTILLIEIKEDLLDFFPRKMKLSSLKGNAFQLWNCGGKKS